jgi:two-component system nitrogen regulation response regulator GlnG
MDIRVIAATNRPLAELMASGQFREDLFFRLSVFQIHIPPLRDRPEDIPALAEHFLRQARRPDVAEAHLTEEMIHELRSRPWPGNARELRNAIEHAAIVARGRTIRPEHLPAPPAYPHAGPASAVGAIQRELAEWAQRVAQQPRTPSAEASLYEQFLELGEPPVLRAALAQCDGNRAAAAQMLGMHRATLRQKLRKYQIE